MHVTTSDDCTGMMPDHPYSKHFIVLGYRDGAISSIPNHFFRDWLDEEAKAGTFSIGRGSGIGVGSIAKYDGSQQSLRIGRFVAGGLRLRFLLNGQHEIRTIATTMFSVFGNGLLSVPPPQYGDIVVQDDVWIGDEAMFLGGSNIASGCVIGARTVVPPNFHTEPYGIYVGSPSRLVRFRFPEKVRESLLELAWWEMPLSWIRDNNTAFLANLTEDEGLSLELLGELKRIKRDSVVAI